MLARSLLAVLALSVAVPAFAQRVPFTRTFDVGATPMLEVTTGRGKIAVRAGTPGRIVVRGTVTVRVGADVPVDAAAIARRISADPPVQRDGDRVTLAIPADPREHRAVTVSYDVEVPPATNVTSSSNSGETTIAGIDGSLSVKTQSAAIDVERTRGEARIDTGSGAVLVADIGGALAVTTSSSSVTAKRIGGRLRVDTGSGAVDASLAGPGPIRVRTGSSGVRLRGLSGAADVETGSGRIVVALRPDASIRLDASTGSGSIEARGVGLAGTIEKRRVTGTVAGGGAEVRLSSRSGSIAITR